MALADRPCLIRPLSLATTHSEPMKKAPSERGLGSLGATGFGLFADAVNSLAGLAED